jgi:SAM-dependent methyltransferase
MLHDYRMGWDEGLHFILFVARLGIYPGAGTRILDFGCGEGAMVYRLRELGFDAYGFDIHDRVKYRNDADRRYFGFSTSVSSDTSDCRLADRYNIPFDDDTFDLVYSGSVLEHVMELDPVMRECARVVKPNGMAIHFYPSMLGLIEPHIYVPLASFFHPRWWLAFWAWLGVRNEFQTGMSVRQAVESNERFYRTGLRYYTRKQVARTAGRYFESVNFPNRLLGRTTQDGRLYPNHSLRSKLAAIRYSLRQPHPIRSLAALRPVSVITCAQKRQTCADSAKVERGRAAA